MTVVSLNLPILDQRWFEESADAGVPLKEEPYIVQDKVCTSTTVNPKSTQSHCPNGNRHTRNLRTGLSLVIASSYAFTLSNVPCF